MTDWRSEKPAAPEFPAYIREPLEKQSLEQLETLAAYANDLAEWKREQREAKLERRRPSQKSTKRN